MQTSGVRETGGRQNIFIKAQSVVVFIKEEFQ